MKKRSYSKGPKKQSKGVSEKYYKPSPSTDHKLLMALKKQLQTASRKEMKFLDVTTSNSFLLNGTATVSLINGSVQGTDEITRLGREFQMTSVYLNGSVASAATTTGLGEIRIIIVYDKQVNGNGLGIGDFLVSDNTFALNNLNNRKRFKVVMDQRLELGGLATVQSGTPSVRVVNEFRKISFPTECNAGVAGTVADIVTGALYLITYSSGFAVAALSSILNTRVRFQDNTA